MGCTLIIVHRNSYLGVLAGRFLTKGSRGFLELNRTRKTYQLAPGAYVEVRGNALIPDGLHELNTVVRMCHKADLRKEDEELWRIRAKRLQEVIDRHAFLRAGTYEFGGLQCAVRKACQLSDHQAEQCNDFALERLHMTLRTTPIDMTRLKPAIEKLYGILDLTAPEIVVYPSPGAAARAIAKGPSLAFGVLNETAREVCCTSPDFGLPESAKLRAWNTAEAEYRIRNVLSQETSVAGYWPWAGSNPFLTLNDWCTQWDKPLTRAWYAVFDECIACWMHEEICCVADFPQTLHVDDAWRLHRDDGPAIAWRDGGERYYIRNIEVTKQVVEAPQTLSVQQIFDEENLEVRRIMIERFGFGNLVAGAASVPIHEDSTGALFQIESPGDESITIVRVQNSTQEPDGTFKDYYLRVPPGISTAREAVAWTFGLESHEYRPSVET